MAGMLRLLFLIWAGVTVSTVVDLQKRIIGGQTCLESEVQHHALLLMRKQGEWFFCGGSLISNQWILTAAHCWKDGWTMTAHLGIHPQSRQREEIPIKEHYIYRGFLWMTHDIMLVKLDRSTLIPPVPLPHCGNNADNPPEGSTVQISGSSSAILGPNGEKQTSVLDTLRCISTTVVDCPQTPNYLLLKLKIHQHRFCYKEPGVDTSGGDSGGGVIFNGMIYGVHIKGAKYAYASEGISMNVCEYMDWIIKKTGITRP